ncbi:lipopolysaccharide biosynthesis protein [Alkalisalibacterium limincola]|uniref:Lipopolysaccharide biosynthesis protein n=1 Tax=Alkalisalibacterium limincola TaxID=2699169 RepID=A0A5C8KWP8_9GAMM|nr:lipopolysaccharide biosynthesis protein [Alkalisalibacterium limincola]
MPTPRGGGVGIVAAIAATLVLAIQLGPVAGTAATWWALAGLLAVAGVGWWDDHRDLPALFRLGVHLAAGLAVALAVLGWPTGPFDVAVIAVAMFWVAGMVNLWNFMDGINGIATAQAALVALAVTWLPGALDGPWTLVALGVCAACIGFLPFNFPQARIFLGDVGSGALGYSLAVLLLVAASRSAPPQWLLLGLLPAVFIVDTGVTLAERIARGRRWWEPHREHAYQWAVRQGHSHARITYLYTFMGLVAAIIAIGFWNSPAELAGLAFFVGIAGLCMARLSMKRIWLMRMRRRRGR